MVLIVMTFGFISLTDANSGCEALDQFSVLAVRQTSQRLVIPQWHFAFLHALDDLVSLV